MQKSSTLEAAQQTISSETATLLDALEETGAGDAVEMSALNKVAQVFGTFVGTVHLEGSNDNINWVSLGSLTAAGKIANTEPWRYIRGNVSAYTSGAISLILGW
jgi:hypothetical protein